MKDVNNIYGVIYKFTNKINGKCYIGQTINFIKRKKSHVNESKRNDSNCKFHNAIRKYGIENFSDEILCECASKSELDKWEKYYIMFYDSKNNGYNMTFGGDGLDSETAKEINNRVDIKNKKSEMMKGENNPNYGKHHSEETKKSCPK